MPQFELNTPAKGHPFYSLDSFAKGYVEAMFFTNGDTGDERENLLNDLGVERLTHKSIASIKRDCDAFLAYKMPDGASVREWLNRVAYVFEDDQAGRNFWFTRQGHGVGFWSRNELDNAGIGEALSKAARSLGECYVEAYRGRIHIL